MWHEVFPTSWVAFENPSRVGLSGGGRKFQDGQGFTPETQSFSAAVMHNMHCLATIKAALMQQHQQFNNLSFETTTYTPLEGPHMHHLLHCTEKLRRTLMCQGDLTLEAPKNPDGWPHRVDGWGYIHKCRDWDVLIQRIKDHALVAGKDGWKRLHMG